MNLAGIDLARSRYPNWHAHHSVTGLRVACASALDACLCHLSDITTRV